MIRPIVVAQASEGVAHGDAVPERSEEGTGDAPGREARGIRRVGDYFLRSARFQHAVGLSALSLVIGIRVV